MKPVLIAALIWLLGAQAAFACASSASGYYDLRLRELSKLDGQQLTYFIGRVVAAPDFGPIDGTVHVEVADATIEILKASLDGKLGEHRVGDKVKFRIPRAGCFLVYGLGAGEVSLFATYAKDGEQYLAGVSGPSF